MATTPTREQLEAAHAWENGDVVPGRPEMTAFRRHARYRQARWRESNGHPMGTQPIAPRPGDLYARLVGSRLPLDYAEQTGANFLTPPAREAARARLAVVEPNQTIDRQRIVADLLWSPALGFNLFGDLAADLRQADRAIHSLWPDTPGSVEEVRFEHSPGRLDPAYLRSLRTLDAAFVLNLGDGTQGILAIDTKYAEWTKPEIPKPENLWRYREVAERSDAFEPGAIDPLGKRSGLALMWLEHLLVLSMLQHFSGAWRWARYVVVYPAGNLDFAEACDRYRGLLADDSTFDSMTLEALLDAGVLPAAAEAAVRERYLLDGDEASGVA